MKPGTYTIKKLGKRRSKLDGREAVVHSDCEYLDRDGKTPLVLAYVPSLGDTFYLWPGDLEQS